jgi:stearoyl-CoA desaturase (delta-9 desaturase)
MAAQGPLIYWVSNHRRHHRFSDAKGDPHSPVVAGTQSLSSVRGFWHAHAGWAYQNHFTNPLAYAPDLYRNRAAVLANNGYFLWVALGLLGPGLAAFLATSSIFAGLRAIYWGGVVRHALSFHATSGINSVTHLYGYRRFETGDGSRNNVLLALPTFGEGWHNNHHSFPSSARLGLYWYEVDIGWLVLRLLRTLRLIENIRVPTARTIARARAGALARVSERETAS